MGHRPIVATKGGVTIKRDGTILGGLGVSGGSPDADQRVCEDVLTAAGFELTSRSGRRAQRRRPWLTTSSTTSTTTAAWSGRAARRARWR